jgi:hypothetical protein
MVSETLQGLYTLWTYEFIHNIYRVLVGVSTTYCGIHIFHFVVSGETLVEIYLWAEEVPWYGTFCY